MSKYDRLRDHLDGIDGNLWRVSFSEIEDILGFRLPPSARCHQAWWANEARTQSPQKLAWVRSGWKTADLDLKCETVSFVRGGTAFVRPGNLQKPLRRLAEPMPPAGRPDHWLDKVLGKLAQQRPVFHSEADFQHALAWAIQEDSSDTPVRLEFKPLSDARVYIDIWLGLQPPFAIELKYPTKGIDVNIGAERFTLANHSAADLRRYDFLKDMARLEEVARTVPGARGFAVLLTNDRAYWRPGQREVSIDDAFHLNEGRELSGELAWRDHAGAGTTKGREQSITLDGRYSLSWRSYSTVGSGNHHEFRYLLVPIEKLP